MLSKLCYWEGNVYKQKAATYEIPLLQRCSRQYPLINYPAVEAVRNLAKTTGRIVNVLRIRKNAGDQIIGGIAEKLVKSVEHEIWYIYVWKLLN